MKLYNEFIDKLVFVEIKGKWKLHALLGNFVFPLKLLEKSKEAIEEEEKK